MKLTENTKQVKQGYLHFWFANYKGRGGSNCTIILSSSPIRADRSKDQTGRIALTTTSAWRGNVNFSLNVQSRLGLLNGIK